jgi:hypothetical protein
MEEFLNLFRINLNYMVFLRPPSLCKQQICRELTLMHKVMGHLMNWWVMNRGWTIHKEWFISSGKRKKKSLLSNNKLFKIQDLIKLSKVMIITISRIHQVQTCSTITKISLISLEMATTSASNRTAMKP